MEHGVYGTVHVWCKCVVCTGFVEVSMMHPLDLIKTRFQIQRGADDPTRYNSMLDCVRKMYRTEGYVACEYLCICSKFNFDFLDFLWLHLIMQFTKTEKKINKINKIKSYARDSNPHRYCGIPMLLQVYYATRQLGGGVVGHS